jgi:hypothetical protein
MFIASTTLFFLNAVDRLNRNGMQYAYLVSVFFNVLTLILFCMIFCYPQALPTFGIKETGLIITRPVLAVIIAFVVSSFTGWFLGDFIYKNIKRLTTA